MLRCNMNTFVQNPWVLDDLLADLHHARKCGDLGRLAFIAYCDVRRWARDAGKPALAEQAAQLVTESPHDNRETFLERIELLIQELEIQHAKHRRAGDPSQALCNEQASGGLPAVG